MSGQDDAARAQALNDFQQLTGYPEDACITYLEAAEWDFGRAAQTYYLDKEDESVDAPGPSSVPENYTGPRTLDGRPAPEAQRGTGASSAAGKRPQQKPQKKKGIATLGSIASSSGGGHGHDDDDDEDDDEEEKRNRGDLFAGGEKSGLAVQDPTQQDGGGARKIISDILAKARSNAARPEADDDEEPAAAGPSQPSLFRGSGQTLGGDGVESRVIPDPNAPPGGAAAAAAAAPVSDEPQERALHLWRDGFSIDDGELHRFDDPANAADLQMIRAGRAPLHLMNVRYDQPVDVKLHQHDENWRPLPKTYKPFGGEGRRLGSEVPGDGSQTATTSVPAPAPTTTAAATSSSSAPASTVDESQPTVNIRIQLPDGARLPARFNTTQTVEDIYQFIQRASPVTQSRPWVLATTFPNKDHTDRSLVLGETPEFKKGGTAVVKWV